MILEDEDCYLASGYFSLRSRPRGGLAVVLHLMHSPYAQKPYMIGSLGPKALNYISLRVRVLLWGFKVCKALLLHKGKEG